MITAFPSRLVGGFEVLEVPNDPYHGARTRSCSCDSCDVAGQANPAFFEYYADAQKPTSSSPRNSRTDGLVLVLIVVVAAVLFCIISNLTSPK